MAFLLFTLSFVFIVIATILYFTRNAWKPYAPPIPYLTAPGTIPEPLYRAHRRASNWLDSFRYSRLPTSAGGGAGGSFQDDVEAGFSSATFDLGDNIAGGDARAGLDDAGKREVQRLMAARGVAFDEARRLYVEQRFGRAGIGPDGRPLDRKAVMFS